MNSFIFILPLLGGFSFLSLIIQCILIVVILSLYLDYKKKRMRQKSDWQIEIGKEVIVTRGFRGRVVKIEDDKATICMTEGSIECALADCVPLDVLMDNAPMLKLGEYVDDYRLAFFLKKYRFPLRSSAARVLKWIRNTRLSLRGIGLMLICALSDILTSMDDILSFFMSGGRSYFEYDVMSDTILPIVITLGIIVGGIMHLSGLYGMEDLLAEADERALTKVHKGFYFFFAAEIVDLFPLAWWIAVILYLIGFIFLIIGYSRLKNSGYQNEFACAGYAKAHLASIFLLIGYILPGIGSVISFIGYVIYYLAWKRQICKAPFEDYVYWEEES